VNRRELLEWISRGLATGIATIIGAPGIRYLLDGFRTGTTLDSNFIRLVRLTDLKTGRPTLVPVMGQKQDGWARHERQTIGRVWLVREQADPGQPDMVRALSSVCPHMGCQLQSQSVDQGFLCPCHRATFAVDGRRQPDPRTGDQNHAPRDLDGLDCRLVQDETSHDWWVEVKYQRFETGREHPVIRS